MTTIKKVKCQYEEKPWAEFEHKGQCLNKATKVLEFHNGTQSYLCNEHKQDELQIKHLLKDVSVKKQVEETSSLTYWEKANETSRKVDEWPSWKKSVHIGRGVQ